MLFWTDSFYISSNSLLPVNFYKVMISIAGFGKKSSVIDLTNKALLLHWRAMFLLLSSIKTQKHVQLERKGHHLFSFKYVTSSFLDTNSTDGDLLNSALLI